MKKIVLVIALCAGLVVAQQRAGSLRGQVLDELGGAIVGANVTVIDGKGAEKSVVTNDSGTRRGLLLPNIDGIRTADQQVGVAARKAGISPLAAVKLFRFRTRRFQESA